MRFLKCALFCLTMLLAVGCEKDESFNVSPNNLTQTVWNAEVIDYDADDKEVTTEKFVVEFLVSKKGKCHKEGSYIIEEFTYEVYKSMISFKGSDLMGSDWYITKESKEQIVLQRFIPNKTVMTLNRVF